MADGTDCERSRYTSVLCTLSGHSVDDAREREFERLHCRTPATVLARLPADRSRVEQPTRLRPTDQPAELLLVD